MPERDIYGMIIIYLQYIYKTVNINKNCEILCDLNTHIRNNWIVL